MARPDRDAALAWWAKAESDLDAAHILMGHERSDTAVYMCQQAAEKGLKALLTYHAVEFEKTHDLTRLLAQAIEVDASLEPLKAAARDLTPYATLYRYPGDASMPPSEEAEDALRQAEQVIEAIRAVLPLGGCEA